MANLIDVLTEEQMGEAEPGAIGKETDWLHLCRFTLEGSIFCVADAQVFPVEGVQVECPPGEYQVSGKVLDFGADRRVSRLRVALKERRPEVGEELDDAVVDTGSLGICDLERFSAAWERLGMDDAAEKLDQEFEQLNPCGVAKLAPDALLPYVDAGFGVGVYSVYELREEGQRVGFEIEFLPSDTPYPEPGEEEDEFDPDDEFTRETIEMLGDALNTFARQQTGDSTADKKLLKGLFDDMLDTLRDAMSEAADEVEEQEAEGRRDAVPLRMVLRPTGDRTEMAAVRGIAAALEKAGFSEVGAYRLDSNPEVELVGFARESSSTYATIARAGEKAVLKLNVNFEDGTSYELTNSGKTLVGPPWLVRESRPEAPPAELIEAFEQRCPRKTRKPAGAEEYARSAEEDYNRYQFWLLEQGDLSEEEIRKELPPV